MQDTTYGIRVDVPWPQAEAVERITTALKTEGFGVLTTIDMQQALREKLGREFRKYVILGACNPPLASRALDAEIDLGLLLPCNVIVYERDGGGTTIAAMAPLAALGLVGSDAVEAIAREADARLRGALTAVEAAGAAQAGSVR